MFTEQELQNRIEVLQVQYQAALKENREFAAQVKQLQQDNSSLRHQHADTADAVEEKRNFAEKQRHSTTNTDMHTHTQSASITTFPSISRTQPTNRRNEQGDKASPKAYHHNTWAAEFHQRKSAKPKSHTRWTKSPKSSRLHPTPSDTSRNPTNRAGSQQARISKRSRSLADPACNDPWAKAYHPEESTSTGDVTSSVPKRRI